MAIHLDRPLLKQYILPATYVLKFGIRREDILYHSDEYRRITRLRRFADPDCHLHRIIRSSQESDQFIWIIFYIWATAGYKEIFIE